MDVNLQRTNSYQSVCVCVCVFFSLAPTRRSCPRGCQVCFAQRYSLSELARARAREGGQVDLLACLVAPPSARPEKCDADGVGDDDWDNDNKL